MCIRDRVSTITDMILPYFSLFGSAPEDFDCLTVVIILTMVFSSGTLRFVQESRSGNAAEKLLDVYKRQVYTTTLFLTIPFLTPKENVALTSKLPPLPILERVGLTEEESRRDVLKLSGGQQQRVAIARALASDAKVVLADVN